MADPTTGSSSDANHVYIITLSTPHHPTTNHDIVIYQHHLHCAYKSRQRANASARSLLRRYGRVDEEWMDEDGLVRGRTLVAGGDDAAGGGEGKRGEEAERETEEEDEEKEEEEDEEELSHELARAPVKVKVEKVRVDDDDDKEDQ